MKEQLNANAIITPVQIEFLGGVCDGHELRLAEAFLDEFKLVDGGDVRREDWERARQLARRIPRNRRARHLADCLIRAIADRLRYEVLSSDDGMPRSG